jgi:Ca2+-binding RTX toxin-like protein
VVLLKNSTIDTASLLDGGNGKDILATTQSFSNLQTAVNKSLNFEVLASTSGPSTFDASSFTGINEFLFTGNTGSSATFRGVESNDRFVLATDVTSGSFAIRVEGKNVGTTATIELRAEMGTGGETVISGRNSSSNSEYGIELRTNISSLVIDSTGTGTNPNLIEVDSGRGGGSNYAIGNESTSSIKITGSHDLTILAKAGVDVSDAQKIVGFSKAANIDASDFSGALRIAGSLHDDIITGGSGNDIIYGMGGNDTMTGNGGSDQFRLAEFYNKTDIIKDFLKGSDHVGLNEFDFTNTTQTQAGATLASTDYVENLNGITQISSSEDKKLVELQASVSGTQITSQTSSSAAEAYVLVHNSTTNKAEIWYDSNWNDTGNRSHILTFDNIVDLSGLIGMSNTDIVEYSF